MSMVTVEVLLFSVRDGCLRLRDLRGPAAGAHPDDVARELAGLTVCTPGALLHSTSWRYAGGGVVLTYAALPDPRPDLGGQPVVLDASASGCHPLTPSPANVDVHAVATHACRHLALLASTDDHVLAAARALPELWEPIAKLAPAAAGALAPIRL